MDTREAVENALILTYYKMRQGQTLRTEEIAGLFVNHYYQQKKIHHGIDTRCISIIKHDEKIIVFQARESTWYSEQSEIAEVLKTMTPSDFYALYLRASFEHPNKDAYDSNVVRNVISVEHYLKAKNLNQEYYTFLDTDIIIH